jgi:hypothetical protein
MRSRASVKDRIHCLFIVQEPARDGDKRQKLAEAGEDDNSRSQVNDIKR